MSEKTLLKNVQASDLHQRLTYKLNPVTSERSTSPRNNFVVEQKLTKQPRSVF